jgi:sterol desaturase/sphingolipid hydroxylase (fatty acid hydroxylase superfamily)
MHRAAHTIPVLIKIHRDHHIYVNSNKMEWKLNNLVLFNDTQISTLDLWLTEVIPTIVFCYLTGQWWILLFYYVWAAFFQESLEHNSNFNFPFLTAGKWHLIHHRKPNKNFGLFFSCWDIIFKTKYDLHQ